MRTWNYHGRKKLSQFSGWLLLSAHEAIQHTHIYIDCSWYVTDVLQSLLLHINGHIVIYHTNKLCRVHPHPILVRFTRRRFCCTDQLDMLVSGFLAPICCLFINVLSGQGDHLSGNPGNVREFDSYQRNVRDFTENQRNVKEKILSGKSCLKLFIVNCIFVSIQVLSRSLLCLKC